jgi:hypothetical protein
MVENIEVFKRRPQLANIALAADQYTIAIG